MTKTISDVSCKGRTPSSIGCARRACSSSGDSSASGGGGATGAVVIVWERLRRRVADDTVVGEGVNGTKTQVRMEK